MSRRFEELDFRSTPIGDVSLRRRWHPALGVDVWEVILGDEHLMSSVFTVAEEELAHLGLAAAQGSPLDVVVGGLGLGYTAKAALQDERVRSVQVVDYLEAVIDWHSRGLVPLGGELTGDPRCSFVHADFFAMDLPKTDVILLDVDHSPRHVLHPSHAALYTTAGLTRLKESLRPGGVFALWSDDPPDEEFLAVMGAAFATARAQVVPFVNPLTGGESSNTVYVATR